MKWIKVNTHHIFHEGFTKTTGWAWIKIMALTAEIEAIPTETQILRNISKYEYGLLQDHFNSVGTSVEAVLRKVESDVEAVKTKRKKDNTRNAQVSQKQENFASDSQVNRRVDKIRLDKIREDESISGETTTKPKSFTIPTIKEINDYCLERMNGINADKFFDYYQSKGWMIGKNKMKDWKAAVRTWEQNNNGGNGHGKSKAEQSAENGRKYRESLGFKEAGGNLNSQGSIIDAVAL